MIRDIYKETFISTEGELEHCYFRILSIYHNIRATSETPSILIKAHAEILYDPHHAYLGEYLEEDGTVIDSIWIEEVTPLEMAMLKTKDLLS